MITTTEKQQTPPCRHFGKCGGCSFQNLTEENYYNLKKNIITDIIQDIGADTSIIRDIKKIGEKSRRRADFKIEVFKDEIKIGFYSAKTHDVVEIEQCPVSKDELVDFLPSIRHMLSSIKKPGAIKSFSVTALDNGIDVIILCKTELKNNDVQKLTELAKENSTIRLSIKIDNSAAVCVYDEGRATVKLEDIEVELPVGAFLQATQKGQNEITKIVLENTNNSKQVADLFSGCGTYSFPLLKNVNYVACFEGSYDMVMATNNAANKHDMANKLLATSRDLFINPLKSHELDKFDTIVINPPRAGAQNQCKQIAHSNVEKIIMVSCNPESFKKDAKILIKGGYKITSVTPIDQFYWNKHLELVAIFEK